MSGPEGFTAEQAGDPRTPGHVLADIAASRPDLRTAVAGNPSAYPGLLEWLGRQGDPAVGAALAAREQTARRAVPYTPPPPYTAPPPYTGAQPYTGPHAGIPASDPPVPTQPYGSAQPIGSPTQPYAPAGHPYASAPVSGTRSSTVVWIVVGVVVAVVALAVFGFLALRGLFMAAVPDDGDLNPESGSVDTYGDDPTLDALWDACAAGDGQACDDLYFDSPFGSEYERFADTCGNRVIGGSYCVDELGGAEPGSAHALPRHAAAFEMVRVTAAHGR